jgi:cobalamin biosynthesis protein CobT
MSISVTCCLSDQSISTEIENLSSYQVFDYIRNGEITQEEFNDWVSAQHERAYEAGQENIIEAQVGY